MATLLLHIAESALSGGMLWLMFLGGLLLAFLGVNHLPDGHLLVLMIFAVLFIALFRGIRAYQDDLDEYRRDLTEYRMNMDDNRNNRQVKKDIIWDRH
jgi:membrane protein implicated in regulation of membrane protease activity